MKATFVITRSARAELRKHMDNPLSHLPRPIRKTLRVTTPRATTTNHHNGVDDYMIQCEYRRDDYHTQNLYTAEYGDDEFGDNDNELDGLTIVECSGEAELFEFCTGYNII